MTTLYYNNNIHNNFHNNKLSKLLLFHKNGKFHKSLENNRAKIMNELLISNPDLLDNFQRRYSKTPCRLRMKDSFASKSKNQNKNNSPKYSNLRIKMNRSLPCKRNQNAKQNKIKNNIRKNNTTPLMKHISEREKEKRKIERREMDKTKNKNRTIKSRSLSHNKDKLQLLKNKKKNENILSRSESFSIFDKNNKTNKKNKINKKTDRKKNKNNLDNKNENNENNSENKENTNNIITPPININENICTPKNDNSNINAYNKINPVHPKACKSPSKVNKKIYKIESLSQVGYSGPGILKYNQDNFFIYKNLNDESNVLFMCM